MCLNYLKIFLPKSTVFVVLYSINAGMRIFPAVYRKETGFSRGEMEKKRNSFSGSLGFVLAAAGSAVGLGNIWRFSNLSDSGPDIWIYTIGCGGVYRKKDKAKPPYGLCEIKG